MANKKRSNLQNRADIIYGAQLDAENTQTRVGGLDRDTIDSMLQPYDPSASYSAGDWCIYEGVNTEVIKNAAPGETPKTHADKYSIYIAGSSKEITSLNNLPVSASAVKQLVDEKLGGNTGGSFPRADEKTIGGVRQATKQEYQDGVNNDTYVTPQMIHDDNAQRDNAKLQVNLQEVTDVGATTNKVVSLMDLKLKKKPDLGAGENIVLVRETNGEYGFRIGSNSPTPTTDELVGKITLNECTQIGGYTYDPTDLSKVGVIQVFIDNEFYAEVTATQTYPALATELGIPSNLIVRWVMGVPNNKQDNNIHTFEIRSKATGKVLNTVNSLGSCALNAQPPVFQLGPVWEETAQAAGANPPPYLANRQQNIIITSIDDETIVMPVGEILDNPGDIVTIDRYGYNIPFPTGVRFFTNVSPHQLFIPKSVTQSFVIGQKGTDTAGQKSDEYWFNVGFNRVNPTPFVIESKVLGASSGNEGGAKSAFYVSQKLSDGSTRVYVGAGTPYVVNPRPAWAEITDWSYPFTDFKLGIPADSINADTPLKIGFRFPDGTEAQILNFTALNAVCYRPSGLTTYQFVWNFTPAGTSNTRLFSSLADANETMGRHFDSSAIGNFTPFGGASTGNLAIGDTIYEGTGVDCSVVNDGILYVLANGAVNTVKKAVLIQGGQGKIAAVLASTYVGGNPNPMAWLVSVEWSFQNGNFLFRSTTNSNAAYSNNYPSVPYLSPWSPFGQSLNGQFNNLPVGQSVTINIRDVADNNKNVSLTTPVITGANVAWTKIYPAGN